MICDYTLLTHPDMQTLSPYVPGKSAEELTREYGLHDIIKLGSNENPFGCSPSVLTALAQFPTHKLSIYPIAFHHPFFEKMAQQLRVEQDSFILGNGSDALFTLIMTCFALHRNKHILLHDYSFTGYPIQAKALGIPCIQVPLQDNWQVDFEQLIAKCTEDTALIFFANPNNPTGIRSTNAQIKHFLENIPPTTLVVLDEAYYEFCYHLDALNALTFVAEHPNLIVTRTFSKAYGLAGLRLGYAVAHPKIISILQRASLPFSINQIALAAAYVAVDDTSFIQQTIDNNLKGLTFLSQSLHTLGIKYLPTPTANFITMDCNTDSIPLYQSLLKHGIIVRPLHANGMNHYLRVTVGTPAQNARFISTLSKLI